MNSSVLGDHPRLLITEPVGAQVRTVVLMLPGGQARSVVRARGWQLVQLRMIPIGALAPWIERGEPVEHLAGPVVVIAHGDLDRITDPRMSAEFSERAAAVGAQVRLQVMPGSGHAMLRHAARWNGVVREFVTSMVNATTREIS